jgi:hypothetical protein
MNSRISEPLWSPPEEVADQSTGYLYYRNITR